MAKAACFSPYHFLLVFRGLVGETPADFVKRLRLEHAAFQLIFSPRKSITEIVLWLLFLTQLLSARFRY